MDVVYAGEEPPAGYEKALFLAGPTPRTTDVESWRPHALALLEQAGYDGVVFVPESRRGTGAPRPDYTDQAEWEELCLNRADCILFWVPRDMQTMPALTTNVVWGAWHDSGKVVLGAPRDAAKVRYLEYYANRLRVPVADSLAGTLRNALERVSVGAVRSEGERDVPLLVWRTPAFQDWYRAQVAAGNTLERAELLWTYRARPRRELVFCWALRVTTYVRAEDRLKSEVVIGRPDIAAVLMYRPSATLDDTVIVLVREIRCPARTADAYIRELPSGSSYDPLADAVATAVAECREETGLDLDPGRLHAHDARQLAGTLTSHAATVFSVELTVDELAWLRAQRDIAHGEAESTERTYVEVTTLGAIRSAPLTDWATLGMIMQIVAERTA